MSTRCVCVVILRMPSATGHSPQASKMWPSRLEHAPISDVGAIIGCKCWYDRFIYLALYMHDLFVFVCIGAHVEIVPQCSQSLKFIYFIGVEFVSCTLSHVQYKCLFSE